MVDKPAGLVVHPGAGNREHTLQNALLGLDPKLAALPRAGIIHRLDKDTSGLLMVARTPTAHTALMRQLAARSVAREYLALCVGVMTGGGTIDEPIGRHRSDRLRMAVRRDGRPAVTHYRVVERFRAHTYLRVKLETGRTHQIRLHLAHRHYPDRGRSEVRRPLRAPAGRLGGARRTCCAGFKRQALHAAAAGFRSSAVRQTRARSRAAGARGFAALLEALRADARGASGEVRPWSWIGFSPDWPAPAGVRALSTLRGGGVSAPPYASLNLGFPRRGRACGGGREPTPPESRRRAARRARMALSGARRAGARPRCR